MRELIRNGRKYFSMPGSMPQVRACTKVTDGSKMPLKSTSMTTKSDDHEERVEKGTTYSFGGASFSDHNRTVFAAQIARALRYNEHGYEGPRLTDEQFDKLTDTLQWIKENPKVERGLGR